MSTYTTEIETADDFNDPAYDVINVDIDFYYSPGEKEVWTYANGDPGHPATAPELEINSIIDETGKDWINLISPKQMDIIQEEIYLLNSNL